MQTTKSVSSKCPCPFKICLPNLTLRQSTVPKIAFQNSLCEVEITRHPLLRRRHRKSRRQLLPLPSDLHSTKKPARRVFAPVTKALLRLQPVPPASPHGNLRKKNQNTNPDLLLCKVTVSRLPPMNVTPLTPQNNPSVKRYCTHFVEGWLMMSG